MIELCIVNDEGVIEDGIYDRDEADRMAAQYGDGCFVDVRSNYDESGSWIEESDENEIATAG